MAEPKENEFLDDIDDAEAEAYADEMSEIDDEALELDELRAERDQLKDRFMRALADAENARKRSDKDRREAENYGGSKLARDMLPVDTTSRKVLASSIFMNWGPTSLCSLEVFGATRGARHRLFALHVGRPGWTSPRAMI